MLRNSSVSFLPAALIASWLTLLLIACGGDSAFDDVPKPCTAGKLKCDGTCFDLQSSPDNCGKCGNACKDAEVCSMGTCNSLCDDGFAKCNRACVNLHSDPYNCGACGNACGAYAFFALGSCSNSCSDTCRETRTDIPIHRSTDDSGEYVAVVRLRAGQCSM